VSFNRKKGFGGNYQGLAFQLSKEMMTLAEQSKVKDEGRKLFAYLSHRINWNGTANTKTLRLSDLEFNFSFPLVHALSHDPTKPRLDTMKVDLLLEISISGTQNNAISCKGRKPQP